MSMDALTFSVATIDCNTNCDARNDDKYNDKASICIRRSKALQHTRGPSCYN